MFGGYRYLQRQYDIVRCRACGQFLVDPLPDEEVLMAVYKDAEYFDDYLAPGANQVGYLASIHATNAYDEMTLALLAQYRRQGRLLDVGCAGGRFLARARDAGYEAFGLEPNARMAAHARDVLGLNVVEGTLESIPERFARSSFDIIHLADVLEHVLDLHRCLETVAAALKPGGLLVLQQPITYNRSLFNALLQVNMFLRRDRYSPYPPLHVWEFTPSTLRRLLADKGFRVSSLKTFESAPMTVGPAERTSAKSRLAAYVKTMSCSMSNSAWISWLELGDRALVVGERA